MSFEALKWAWAIPLKSGLKLVLIRLADMADNKGGCWPKQSTIAKDTGLSRSTVSRHIKELEELFYIEQIRQRYRNGQVSSSYYKLTLIKNELPCLKIQHSEIRHGNLQHSKTEHHNVLNCDNNNNQRESSLREDICVIENNVSNPETTNEENEVQELFSYWQAIMKHPRAKLDSKRKDKIKKALSKGYPIDQLKLAIDGCARSPFNMGLNENKQKYNDIELIFRDSAHIERFIERGSFNNQEITIQNNPHLAGIE